MSLQALMSMGVQATFKEDVADFSKASPTPLFVTDATQTVSWE
jgi:serine protease inhibitor